MNAPVVLAQLQGISTPTGAPPRHIKLEKPQSGATVTVYLNGPIQLDFADIASDKLTFVRVGDKLVVLFDNQSTVTLEPVFGPDGHPLNNVIFEMAPDHMLTGDQFASDFPITTDQSILPAAGSGPTSGAHFSDPTVDALSTGTALALLGAENNGRSVNGFSETPANTPPSSTPIALVVLNEDGLPGGNPGGPGDVGTLATTFTGSLNINFGTALVGRTASFAASQPGLDGLTSGGEVVHFVVTTAHGEPTLIGYVGADPSIVANEVLTVTLDATATVNGEFTVTLMRPLDDPIHGVEDNLILNIGVIATNGVGRSTTNTISVEVNDDSPVINVANETHSTIIDAAPGSVVTAAGSLGISWGADNFNDHVDGGVSATTGKDGDRAVIFTNTNVTTTGDNGGVVTSFTGLTSGNQAVHYVLLDNGTTLVAYTGNTAPTAIPTDATSAASEHVVFTVALTDDSATGGYIVTQYEPLDHISGGTKFDSVDLTFNFTATDSDGDPVSGTLTLTVGDTVPTVTAVTAETVGEDGLPAGNHIKGDVQAVSVTSSLDVNWGSDNETVSPGGSFGRTLNFLAGDDSTVIAGGTKAVSSLAMTISGEQGTALSSEGVALVYVVTSNGNGGETLTAHQGSTTGAVIFTLSLDPTAANGAYTFTLNGPLDDAAGSNNIALNFTVQATDADGDAVNQSFTVNVQDDVPVANTGTPETVKEANLLDGSSPDIHDLSVTGSLNVSWGADNNDSGNTNNRSVSFQHASASADVQVTDGYGNAITGLTSNGATVQYLIFNGELIAYTNNDPFHHQVFTVSLNDDGSGSYTFTLLNNLDHPAGNGNNTLNLTFDFTATDSDGDPASNTFTVTVVDDVPTAHVGDEGFINEANLPEGNAPLFFGLPVFPQVTGDLNITWGADNNLNGFDPNHSRSVSFTNSSAALDVTATSTDPASHVTTTITGLTSDGHTINYAFLGNELVGYTGSNPHANQVFTVTLSPLNDGSYTFTLLGTLDNPPGQGTNPINLTFSYTATDSDGDTSSNLFTVSVKDSVPLAFGADNGHVDEDDLSTGTSPHASALADTESLHIGWGSDDSTRSVGDTFGRTLSFLDGNSAVISGGSVSSLAMSITGEQGNNVLTSGGTALVYTVTANVNGGETLTAFKGVGGAEIFTLTLDPTANNGAYTFTLMGPLDDALHSNSIGLTFTVQAADADGDPVNTSFTVSIADDQPTDSHISTATVGEEGLSFANHNVHGEVQNASTGAVSLNINWGADNSNPTPGGGLDDRSVAFASSMVGTLNNLHLTSNGQSLSYAISTDPVTGGQLLTATAGSDHHTVFTVLLSDANNGTYTFTLSDNLDHASSNTPANNQALTFNVVATDSDGDAVNQSFTVNVQDDVPILVGNVTNGTVSEDGLSSGNHINGVSQVVTLTNEALNISWGADSATHPGDANGRTLSFNVNNNHGTITPVDSSGHALNLTSDGTALQYVLTNLANGGQEIDAYRGSSHTSANLIFTVTLDPTATDGAYSFTLSGNLDDLSNGQPTSDLKLNFGVTAADSDGDTVQTNFTVDVLDDVPTVTGNVAAETVSEGGLTGGNSPGAATSIGTTNTPEALNINWGADNGTHPGDANGRTLSFLAANTTTVLTGGHSPVSSLAMSITGEHGTALSSGGVALVYTVTANSNGGETLTAFKGSTNGAEIFTLTLDPTQTHGGYVFNLLGPLDDASNSSSIGLTFTVQAADSDGDTVNTSFTVNVTDDAPTIGSSLSVVSEDGPLTQTNVPLGISFGADNSSRTLVFTNNVVTTTDLHGNAVALTSYGNAVSIGFIGAELIGYTGTSAPTLLTDNHIVFTATLSASTGTYDFSLKQPLDNPAPFSVPSGIQDDLDLTFNVTATDGDGSQTTGSFSVLVDGAGSVSTAGLIDYSKETTGVFVNLSGDAVTFGGQTVAAHTATDLASGGGHVIGNDQLGSIANADGGSANDVFAITSTQFAAKPTIKGGGGTDTLVITDAAATIVDSEFANISSIETLKVQSATVTLGADASAEIGTGTLLVDARGESVLSPTQVDFTAMTGKFAFIGGAFIFDTVTVTDAQFESGLSLSASNSANVTDEQLDIATAATITDAAFANVSQFSFVNLGDFTNSVTLGANAAADAVSSGTFGELVINDGAAQAGHDLTVDATAFGLTGELGLDGGAGDDLFKVTYAELHSGNFFINGGDGSNTIDIADSASFTLIDGDFANVTDVKTLQVAAGAGATDTITLGTNFSANANGGTFTVDASGESATGSTVADFSAMNANVAFDGGAGNDTVLITSTQFAAKPIINGRGGTDTLVITDAGAAITDSEFANISGIETLKVQSANVTLGADASAEIGSGTLLVDARGENVIHATNVDFTAMTGKFAFIGGAFSFDTVTVTDAQFESGLSLSASNSSNITDESVVISTAATITDAAFANVSQFSFVDLGDFTNSVTLGANAAADAVSFGTFGQLIIDDGSAKAGHDLTVDATAFGVSAELGLEGGAGDDLFKITFAELDSGKFFINGGDGSNTIELTDTASFNLTDSDFANVANVKTLQVAAGAGATDTLTLGGNFSANADGGTFTVDASGESATGSTVVDFSAMNAKFAFIGGAGNDTVKITNAQLTVAPHISGGGGTDTIDIVTTTGFNLVDADFANVSGIETLKVAPGAGDTATITLGADASAEVGTGTLTVDASGEDSSGFTVVDFTAMTAKFAFVGGDSSADIVTVTNAQFESGLSLSDINTIASNTVIIADAADVTDAAFASVRQFEVLQLGDFTNSVTLGADAAADAVSAGNELIIDGSAAKAGHDLTVDASAFGTASPLLLFGGAGDDLFKVTAAGLDSGNFSIDGEGGSNTIELVGTANFSLDDNAFSSVHHIGTLKVDGSSGANDKLTLGENANNNANGGTFTIDDTAGHENLAIDAALMDTNLVVSLGSGNDTVTGGIGFNTFFGGTGADDFIFFVSEAHFETVTGGAGPGIQTQTVDNPTDVALTFEVGAIDAAHLGISLDGALVISDTKVQELVFNLGSAGDAVVVTGSLDGTGIATNTITINGGAGNDTVDLSKFTSGQDVVYNGAGNGPAGDTVIYGFALSAGTYAPILDSNGHLIGASITYQSADGAVTDTITNVENFKFSDQTVSLPQLFGPTITSGNTGSEPEGTAVTNVVYHIAAADPLPNAVLAYSLSGRDAADFNVSSTGDVTFKSVPNFETQSAYNIIVHVNDGTTDVTEAVTIHVTDVAPVAVADSYIEVKNTTATVNAASGVLANDSDVAGGALTAVLVSGPSHDSSFTLNADGSFTYKASNNYTGPDSFTYEASDGTDLSNLVTVNLTVASANAAPVLTPFGPQLTSVHTANAGQTIASFIGNSITDVDAGAVHGIAITATTSSNGAWQYSTNGGVTWTNVGTVSGSQSLLLKDTDLIRYEPSNSNGSTDTFTYRAWDETTGTDGSKTSTGSNGGTTAFSTATDIAHITATTDANHAPVLTPSSPTLAVITEDQTNPAGTTIATLLGSHVSDADPQALQGIAISGATSTHGTWEFSTNGGTSWQNFGTYSTSSALLLAATDEVRFVPDKIDGSTDTFSFVAWDQTTGTHGTTADTTTTGGTTAFSAASDTASISVTAIDDAPTVHAPTGAATAPQGVPVTVTGLSVSDVDAGNAPISVTLTVAHGAISLASTAGLTFSDSDGSDGTLAFTGSQQAIDTALASGVVYTSTGNYVGSDAISVLVNDLGNTGQGGPLTGTGSAAISVVTPHHAPQGADNTVTTNEDTHYTFAAADFHFSDPNDTPSDSFSGVVITTLPTNGALTDNGNAVTSGETISIADINAGDLVFTPAANANGTDYASFTFQVQDNGIAYAPENTDQTPNTMTVNVSAVNDPPTISYAGPQSSPTNIVVNGGFETGDLTGWSQSEISIMATNGGGLSHSGFHAAEAFFAFGSPPQDLTQTLTTVVGQSYTYDFWVMHSTAVPSLSDSFTATFGSTQLVSLTGAAAENSFLYTEFTGTVVATSTSTVLDFNFFDTNNNGGGYIWYLDDVSVIAKPSNIASVNEGTNLVFSAANGNALQVADVDVNETPAPNNIMQVTLGVAHGDLTLSETAGISFISGGNGTGAMVIQGTLAALDSALNGLTYQADNFSGSDTLSINVNDLGHTGIGGPQSANSSVVITVVQNIPASFSGVDTGSVTESSGVNNSIPGTPMAGGTLIVTDPDSPNTVMVENNIATLYGHFSISAAGVWSYTLDNTNPAVDALNTTSTPLQDVMTVTTADGSQHNIDVTIHGANDAATFGGTDTGSVTEAGGVNNGTAGIPTAGGTLTVSDVDNPATIVAESNVATAYGHFSIDANGVWSYTLDDNNATVQALNTNSTPLQDVITVTSADGTTHQIDVTINGADDASVNTVPGAQTVSNAAQLTFSAANGDAISVADVDNTTLTETLTVSHGTLTLASEAGLSFSAGHDGTSTMTFTGTVAAIDSALDGLVYTPASGYSGADTLQIATNDGSLETDSSVAITVFVPDHPPMITSAPESGTVVANASFNVPLGQLVSDGGFENFALSPPWTVVDQAGDTATTTGGGHSGDDAGFLTATTNTGDVIKLSQTLNTVAGVPYTISFWMQSINPLPSGSFSSLRVLWDGTSELFLQNMSTANNWVEYTLNVIGTGQDTIQFNMQDRVTYILLDDVSVQANFTPGTETTSGQITFTDADVGDTHTISVAPNTNVGTFTATLGTESSNGSTGTVNWTFAATDAQISALVGAQQTVMETYTVTINDGHGGVTSQVVTIDLTNPDHAPQITSAPETGSVIENLSNSVSTGQLILNGGFESGSNGLSNWTTTKNSGLGDVIEDQSFPAQAGKQSLTLWTGTDNAGDVVTLKQSVAGTVAGVPYTLTFFVSNQDDFDPANFIHVLWNNQTVLSLDAIPLSGFGDYTEYSVTLMGTGTTSTLEFDFQNAGGDYAIDSVSLVAATTPGTEKTAGIITFTDADAGDTHTVSVAPIAGATGYIGTLTATIGNESTSGSPGTVDWTYSVSDAAAASLAPGQSLTQTYVVTLDDGHGGVTSQDVTITIHGPAPSSLSGASLDLTTASDSGSSSTDNITNVTQPTITVNGLKNTVMTAGDVVEIIDTSNGNAVVGSYTVQQSDLNSSGQWASTNGPNITLATVLGDGSHAFAAVLADTGGAAGTGSATLTVTEDTTPPAVTTNPLTNLISSGGTFSIGVTDAGGVASVQVTDTTRNNSFNASLSNGSATSGTWTKSSESADTNSDNLTITITDKAGNVTTVTGKSPAGVSGEAVNLALTDYSDHSGLIAATITGLAAGWVLSEGTHNADGSWSVSTSDIGSLTVTSPDGYVGALVANVTESWTNADGTHGAAVVADNIEAYAQGSPIFAWSGDDTLTASAGNNTLVFANRIGNDVVHNFDNLHDKIDLIGFNGFASFADVQAHLSHDASGNAVITLADGETITLNGVAAASLNAGDFEFNQTPVTNNTGDMVISDGAMMPLSGIVDNTGSIHVSSTGTETDLEIVQHGVTLEGGGTLVLSDNAGNVIFGSDASVTFTNVDNTISGAGQLGDGQMALVNEGTIIADGSNALVIDTGSNAIVNTGTLEALGLGGLVVHSDLVNEGVLWANGGNLTLDGDVSGSGSVRISGNASLEIGGTFAEQVQFDDSASGTLKIDHSADFKGILSGLGSHDAIDLGDILAANASISYTANAGDSGGVLTVTDGSNTANIALSGEYASADFHIAADQSNHALVQIEQHAQHMAAAA